MNFQVEGLERSDELSLEIGDERRRLSLLMLEPLLVATNLNIAPEEYDLKAENAKVIKIAVAYMVIFLAATSITFYVVLFR